MDSKPIWDAAEGLVRGAAAFLSPLGRKQRERWGATDYEFDRMMPGDDMLPVARWASTHAINIEATPDEVWPWVIQIGQGRGGFYSYDTLENMIGNHTPNAEAVMEEFQDLRAGDEIRLHRTNLLPALEVREVNAPHHLLLGREPQYDRKYECTIGLTWLFLLEPTPEGHTRLLVRWRMFYDPDTIQNRLTFGAAVVEPITYVMETKMMEGIKQRAEAQRAGGPAPE